MFINFQKKRGANKKGCVLVCLSFFIKILACSGFNSIEGVVNMQLGCHILW